MSVSAQHALEELKWSVQALACEAEVQFTLFPNFTHKPDELVLEFDNWYHATKWRDDIGLSPDRLHALDLINSQIESMGPDRFDDNLVVTGYDWKKLRELARSCAVSWEWPLEPPPLNRAVYIKSK